MRMIVLSAAALSLGVLPAAACSYGKAQMTMAGHAPAVSTPVETVTVPAPVEVALRDVWLERMIG